MGRTTRKKMSKRKRGTPTSEANLTVPKEVKLTDKLSRLFYSWMKKKRAAGPPTITLRAEQYNIRGLICEGTFGQVMMAQNIYTKVTVAAKLEPKDARSPQLHIEYNMYELLGSETPGFITIYHYGPCDKLYNVLIMELLGPDLDDLFVACKGIFSYKTVLMIAIQTIKLMKHVHNKNIIYRDVKPENFCIGHRYQNKENIIHIIDFGLSKIQNESASASNLPDIHYDYLVGTARYMSVNAHFGVDQSKRDDLESLGYMYLYFLNGRLPWMGLSKLENLADHYRGIAEMKKAATPEELAHKYPELVQYLRYVKGLKFQEEPDYDYILSLIKNAFNENGFTYDCEFDWNNIMNQRFLKGAIEIDPDD